MKEAIGTKEWVRVIVWVVSIVLPLNIMLMEKHYQRVATELESVEYSTLKSIKHEMTVQKKELDKKAAALEEEKSRYYYRGKVKDVIINYNNGLTETVNPNKEFYDDNTIYLRIEGYL